MTLLANEDLERSVIGALLIDPDQLPDVRASLASESFTGAFERVAYTTIATLSDKGVTIDFLTVADECEKQMPTGNWLTYLANLSRSVPSAVNVLAYAKGVSDYAWLRRIYQAGEQVCRSVTGGGDLADRIASAQEAVSDVMSADYQPMVTDAKQALRAWIDDLSARADGHASSGLMTGFNELDDLSTGFQPGELIILAARPGCGKTVLALQIAGQAIHENRSVLFFSLEMQTHEMISRLASCQTRIPHRAIKTADLHRNQWDMITSFVTSTQDKRLFTCDKGDQSIDQIRAQARAQRNKTGVDLVVVDYLQLVRGEGESDTVRVSNVSRGLKAMAKELNCPVIALSQFSRAVEQRADGRPRLSDLRSSGQIEQDADFVMFLHRADASAVELIVEKNRHGKTGSAWLAPRFDCMRFDPGSEPVIETKQRRGLEF